MNDRRLFVFRTLGENDVPTYADKGFLHLGRVVMEAGLEAMRAECMSAWRAEKGEFDPAKTWLQNALLSDIHHRSAVVRDYYYRGPLAWISHTPVATKPPRRR